MFVRLSIVLTVIAVASATLAQQGDTPKDSRLHSWLKRYPAADANQDGVLIHHAYFGKVLKARLDELGVQNQLLPQTDPRKDGSRVILDWLTNHL